MTGYHEIGRTLLERKSVLHTRHRQYGTSSAPREQASVARDSSSPISSGRVAKDCRSRSYLRSTAVPGLVASPRALVRRLGAKARSPRILHSRTPLQSEDIAREAVATARSIPALSTKPLVVESTGLERQIGSGPKVALLDTGVKENQIRCLVQKGATVKVFPATAMAREILSWSPDGIVISNGPAILAIR